jgi:hypothetical protein
MMARGVGTVQRRGTTTASGEAERRESAGRTVSGLHPPADAVARPR